MEDSPPEGQREAVNGKTAGLRSCSSPLGSRESFRARKLGAASVASHFDALSTNLRLYLSGSASSLGLERASAEQSRGHE